MGKSPHSVSSSMRQNPTIPSMVIKNTAIAANAELDVGRFNSIRNNSSDTYASVAVKTHWLDDDGNNIIVQIRQIPAGQTVDILGIAIVQTGTDEDGDTVTTAAGVRWLSVGRY